MRRLTWTAFVATTVLIAIGHSARAATRSGPLLLVQVTEGSTVAPFTEQSASLVIGNDHSLTVIIGRPPEGSLVYAGTIQQEDIDRLQAAMATSHIGIQTPCAGPLSGTLSADNFILQGRVTWFGPRRVHTFNVSGHIGALPSCSTALEDLFRALSQIVFDVERDGRTVIIH
jgi:hypothetical protein